jgi:hypothetical protein
VFWLHRRYVVFSCPIEKISLILCLKEARDIIKLFFMSINSFLKPLLTLSINIVILEFFLIRSFAINIQATFIFLQVIVSFDRIHAHITLYSWKFIKFNLLSLEILLIGGHPSMTWHLEFDVFRSSRLFSLDWITQNLLLLWKYSALLAMRYFI